MKTFAERLTYALEWKGMSQSELARRINIKPQSVQHLCTVGKKSGHTSRIAEVLGINANWLADGTGSMLNVSDPIHRRIMQLLVSAKSAIDESGQELTKEEIYRVYRVVIDACMDENVADTMIHLYIDNMIKSKHQSS